MQSIHFSILRNIDDKSDVVKTFNRMNLRGEKSLMNANELPNTEKTKFESHQKSQFDLPENADDERDPDEPFGEKINLRHMRSPS